MFHMDAAHVSHGTPRMFLQSVESAYKAIRTPVIEINVSFIAERNVPQSKLCLRVRRQISIILNICPVFHSLQACIIP